MKNNTTAFRMLLAGIFCLSIILISCSGNARENKDTEHKSDSIRIVERTDTAYVPIDPKDPASALVPKIVITKDTVRIKR
jgi:hypothetical protein